MEGKAYHATINRVYEDFEPSEEWAREEAYDTLVVYLPGFKKENMRIQVTSSRNVRVLGERPVGHDNKWLRFRKEFPIPSNCDANDISAKFESGILYVKLPKMIAPEVVESKDEVIKPPKEAPKAPTEAPKAPKEAPKAPTEAPKAPKEVPKAPTEAPKAPKEAPKAPTEATKPPKPISTSDQPQPQKANANQEQVKKSNGSSSQAKGNSNYVPPRIMEKEKEPIAQPSKVNKGTTSHVEAEASNVAQKKEKSSIKSTEKFEDNRGKKVEDSTKEDYNGAIFGNQIKNAGVDKCCRPLQGYKQVISGLIMELKQQPKKLVNLGLAFLFVLVLGLYVKHAISFIQEFQREEL